MAMREVGRRRKRLGGARSMNSDRRAGAMGAAIEVIVASTGSGMSAPATVASSRGKEGRTVSAIIPTLIRGLRSV